MEQGGGVALGMSGDRGVPRAEIGEQGGGVALGMSGGVDSAVAGALLLRAGYRVVGVTCRFCDDEAADRGVRDARKTCEFLGIPHVVYKATQAFEQNIIAPFVHAYACGLTPSPCLLCNAHCKIPALMQVAKEFDCTHIATGHYARVVHLPENGRYAIQTAQDTAKDQSYMLALLSQEHLSRLILPLGSFTKAEVRLYAANLELPVAQKSESQDTCFIKGDYRSFLSSRAVRDVPGDIVDSTGRVIGHHQGLSNYTIGQRKGIRCAASEPYYVIEKQVESARLVVGFANEALIRAVSVSQINWQACKTIDKPCVAMVKLRYRSCPVACMIEPKDAEHISIALQNFLPTTAPGQYAVMYRGRTVLGGGIIEEVTRA